MAWRHHRKRFSGGFLRGDATAATRDRPIETMPPPARLLVPLAQFDEAPAEPRVRTGQHVAAGQVLAGSAQDSSAADPRVQPRPIRVHAPVDATVGAVRTIQTPYCDGVPAIELVPDAAASAPAELPPEGLPDCDIDRLANLIAKAGITLGDEYQASTARPQPPHPDYLIVNGLDSDPVRTVVHRILIERPDDVVTAATWLHRTTKAKRTLLVTDRSERALLSRLRRAARGTAVRVAGAVNHYPHNFTKLAVRAVTGREVPCLDTPSDVGVWVLDPDTLLAVARAAGAGIPQAWLTVTVTGDAVAKPGNYRIALGTTVGAMAEHAGADLANTLIIAGNPLAAPAVRDLDVVLTKRTGCLVFLHSPRTEPRLPVGCIRCGLCQDHCPVGIDPRAVLDLVERGRSDQAAKLYPAACVDCGLCDYVCPSFLPLMRAVQRSRRHVLSS